MIKKLLGSLVLTLLLSGCTVGDGIDGLRDDIVVAEGKVGRNQVNVYIEDICFSLNSISPIVLSCEQFYEQIDLEQIEKLIEISKEEGSILCHEITVKDINGKEHTGFYLFYEKGWGCD